MKKTFKPGAFALAAALILPSLGAVAATPDTLEKIRQTHQITLGTRDAARPFSYLDEQKKPVGYSVDLCLKAVEQIAKELKITDLKVNTVTVSGAERIPKLLDGTIDLECGSTTNTKVRQEKVDFSYTIFIAGMKIATRVDSGIAQPATLAGKTVALSRGTTSEKLFTQLRDSEIHSMKLQLFPNNTDAMKALLAGKVQAFAQDDVLLAGLLSTQGGGGKFAVVGDYLSIEPYAIMMRKGDTRLRSAVDRALTAVYSSGEINTIYKRWFATDKVKLPMSALLRDAVTRPSRDPGIARLLGYSI
ncbi:amino acid ABC transporter substrate-binding protein [Niveibacterium terrae]|uniref:amino acid ABC transporter substrate-binding protein n=1 Tax=Niveibacterium terrae TaxID=3373598 RepID=UPI003A8E6E86